MTITLRPSADPDDLLQKVEALSGQSLAACYQCGTCTASCPLYEAMDLLPDALILHLRLGLPGVLEREAFWVCVGCDSCVERCPRAINVARIMEALRQICLRDGGDHLALDQLPQARLVELPPIALVASLRRHTG